MGPYKVFFDARNQYATPKVFLSHASEDKKRSVLKFATSLREKGIDVWLDKWEILPGDSLVDKLFEEGLKEAQAVLIVISAISVTKPWVRQEFKPSAISSAIRATVLLRLNGSQASGVAVPTVYAIYRSKRALLFALLDQADARADVAGLLSDLHAAAGNPRRQLRRGVSFTCRFYAQAGDIIDIVRGAGRT